MKQVAWTVVLLGIAAVAGAQTVDNEVINVRQPVAAAFVNPCSGEPLVFEGECHVVVHTRTTANGDTATMTHTNCHGNGVGAFGGTYTVGVNSLSRSETPLACGTSQRYTERAHFITPRNTQNFFLTMQFVVTLDQFCQPHVVVDEQEARCSGRPGVF